MKKKPLAMTVGIASVIALTLSACSAATTPEAAPEASKDLTTLKVVTGNAAADAALQMGIDEGLFEDEGLEIELSLQPNPPAAIASLQGGQIDVAFAPNIPMLNAMSQGLKLEIIAPAYGYPDEALDSDDPSQFDDTAIIASPASGITDIRDLDGKTISVPARKAQLEVIVTGALKDAGVDPSSINWVTLDFVSSLEALKNGTIDAAGLITPFMDEAERLGMPNLGSPGLAFAEKGAAGVWLTSSAIADSKRDAIAGFQRAMLKSNATGNRQYGGCYEDCQGDHRCCHAGRRHERALLAVGAAQGGHRPHEREAGQPRLPAEEGRPLGGVLHAVASAVRFAKMKQE
ncbi:ABC transporter substrate-binding protein [Mycetocola sp.]|uniref:ABC transporter substrate-binding protein n=1 Tax=Mycetocola sp. TaxID=1871042 RepID=UPI003989FF7B